MINHLKLLINETAHKIKKVLLFIMKQCKKILRTVFQPHFYKYKKPYNTGNFDLIFNIFTINRSSYSY